jgi:hypothetical protein
LRPVVVRTGGAPTPLGIGELAGDPGVVDAPGEEFQADAEVPGPCGQVAAATEPGKCAFAGDEERAGEPVGFGFLSAVPVAAAAESDRWCGFVLEEGVGELVRERVRDASGDLLRTEIGLPEADAESITASFVEAAKAEGYEQETESSPLGNAVLWTLLVGIIVTLGIGVWTIVTRITVEVVVVALLLAAFWLVPAILILRWRDRRRDRPVA